MLCQYGLTLEQVAQVVRKASLDLPAGRIKTSGGEILIRTKGRRYRAADYADVAVLTRADGSKVTLSEIAGLNDGFEDVDLFARFQEKPAALIRVFRVANQNALSVAKTVKRHIEDIRPGLPAGVNIEFFADESKFLRSRLELLLKNLFIGLLLVIVLLGLLLNLRLAFWVTLGIPISFMAGLMVLPQLDVSINMVSLFAFIMVLGIVVDDAIIIGDNIFRKSEEGLPPLKAAIEGASEVGRPVVFSVLTTIVAFWPLLLGGGFMGKKMRIRTSDGKEAPFNQVAQVNMRRGFAAIERGQRRRVVKVTADVNQAITNANELRIALENGFLPELKSKYPDLNYSIEGEGCRFQALLFLVIDLLQLNP